MAKTGQLQDRDPAEGGLETVDKALQPQHSLEGSSAEVQPKDLRPEGFMPDDGREARIRARAYRLWEEAGRPEGREGEHWEAARREIEALEDTKPEAPM